MQVEVGREQGQAWLVDGSGCSSASRGQICMGSQDVTETLRLEEVGALASKVSAFPLVRAALRTLQLSFHRMPGLVADGRDMGTVDLPRRRPQGLPHRQRRRRVPSGGTSN